MSQGKIIKAFPHVNIKQHSAAKVLLKLSLNNQQSETLLLRPTLDNWVLNNGEVLYTSSYVNPAYIHLFQGNKAEQTMIIQIPGNLEPGEIIKSWLRFPGIHEESIPINIEILSESEQNISEVLEVSLEVNFPLTSESQETFTSTDNITAGIFGLISGLIDLDKIPSGWLWAELLVVSAQTGEEEAKTESGKQLLNQLRPTIFFQNGVTAWNNAQMSHWIANTLSTSNSILGGQPGTGHLLHIWEQWLFSLAETDVETGQMERGISVPPLLATEFVQKLGENGALWFGNIILGLAKISPKIKSVLQRIATSPQNQFSYPENQTSEVTYSLKQNLPWLETLPVRWLVVELLLIISQIGNQYARTELGSQLLTQLSRTRFFKNGVIALASAQMPRWVNISQYTASAFQAAHGNHDQKAGLLVFWENWLWSLAQPENKKILASGSSVEKLIKKLGMDSQQWFSSCILGLAVVSPRINTTLQAIAATAPVPTPETMSTQPTFEDLVGQQQQLLR
ncbi:MAG: hypothetical protein QNJ68_21540 [Microcoleaceae cyanobacterium MO_207.B10]|nr:hypothetical protein [Microcoleaceae cyanobacterium MO_207.B10]